jgi:NADPH-dependent stearoyl-CoA 9-desaturase
MTTSTINVGPRTLEELEAFRKDIDAIRNEVHSKLGEEDARYIRGILRLVRVTETVGRALLMVGWILPLGILGAVILGISKIIDNMELGHNVMHGQFSWMNDKRFHGDTFEWDNTCPKEGWRHVHNYVHHHYTNVIGKDRDFGYGMLRLSSDLRWRWFYHPIQGIYMLLLMVFFEWFVALHEIQTDKLFAGKLKLSDMQKQWDLIKSKMWRQVRKDYIMWPLFAAAVALPFGHGMDAGLAVLAGNFVANLIRNVWAAAIIFCGHFTDGIYTFDKKCVENEHPGQWYLRQILGSSNITGGSLMHLMSGNLSHQIEHHLFPDMPGNRYKEIAPKVRAVCAKYGLPYNTGRFIPQLLTVFKRVARYSFPGGPQHAEIIVMDSILPEKA